MKVWVYLDGRQQGPFEDTELSALPGFSKNTKVWFEGLPKWFDAGTLEQLNHVFEPQEVLAEEEIIIVEESSAEEPDAQPWSPATDAESAQETPPERPSFLRAFPGQVFGTAQQSASDTAEPCPPTYVGLSIFLFLCCCSPISIAALVASICVSVFYSNGKFESARKASEVTEWLIMIAIALGMIPVMLMSAIFG